jgi:hypothetical protein
MLSSSSYLRSCGNPGLMAALARSCAGRGDFESDLRRVIKR